MSDLAQLDATAQAALVRSREISASELLEAAIARVEALNPELNAVIHPLFEEGRAAAAGELPEGPFTGVPLLIKDLGPSLAGAPLHMGMRFLKQADMRGPIDSFLIERFRAAGFVIFGKTNVPELGILPTTEPDAYGPTLNPWDTTRSPGGSSGGSAAAVSAGMVAIAHGNDGGGSIRVPAAACGLVGLKPTRARVSQGPLVGDVMSGLTHEGVLTRSVRDTAAALDAIQGASPGDPYVAPDPARPYVEELGADPGRLRIGLMTKPPTDHIADPEVVAGAERTAKLLEDLGHEVTPMDMGFLGELELVDTFLVRWAAGQAALVDLVSTVVGRPATREDVEPLTWELVERGRAHTAAEYLAAVGRHQTMSRMIAALMESFDLVLSPTMGEPPVPLGTYDDSGPDPIAALLRAATTVTFAAGINATGQPAISLPLHWSPEGLPVGVHLLARFGGEGLLIRIASQLEAAQPWAHRRPPLAAGAPA